MRLPGGVNMAFLAMEMSKFARELELENQTFRAAQKACEDCDAPRVDRIEELERELEQERQDRKQADVDTIRALGERNDERALADRLAETLADVRGDYPSTGSIMAAELDNSLTTWMEVRNGTR